MPIEVESVEETCGHILNLDLCIDAYGIAHLLYLKRPHQHAFIRDRYFPGQPITAHLTCVTIKDGRVVSRRILAETAEDGDGITPSFGRFHVNSEGQLHVVMVGTKNGGTCNYIARITETDDPVWWIKLNLKQPFTNFFTNTVRGGSKPGDVIDLFGISDDLLTLRYAAIRLRR
jgi:hypothetical protein